MKGVHVPSHLHSFADVYFDFLGKIRKNSQKSISIYKYLLTRVCFYEYGTTKAKQRLTLLRYEHVFDPVIFINKSV